MPPGDSAPSVLKARKTSILIAEEEELRQLNSEIMLKATRIFNPTVRISLLKNTATEISLIPKNQRNLETSGLFTNGFQVTLPKGSCASGQLVTINLIISEKDTAEEMKATGKITSTTATQDQILVAVEFLEYDKDQWNQLLQKLESRQDNVTQVVNSIKGQD